MRTLKPALYVSAQIRAERVGLGEVGNVAAVQDVEATVGEHQWARQLGQFPGQRLGRADFAFEIGGGPGSHGSSSKIIKRG